MKRIAIAMLLLSSSVTVASARGYDRNSSECPKLYVGVSSGLENTVGLIGLNLDVPVTQRFSFGTGIGRSSWGWKTYGEARFYFGECNRGWALGTGVTYNTGIEDFATILPTRYFGDQTVPMDLEPKVNVFLAGYRFWNLGKNGHRLYMFLGYSLRLDENNYTLKDPITYELAPEGEQVMQVLAPGGLMLGFGFSFGVLK